MSAKDEDKKQSEAKLASASTEQLLWLLYALLGVTIVQSALVLLGNESINSVLLLVILAVGMGQALLLPARFAWFGLLAAIVAWVLTRQAMGIWVQAQMLQSTLEVAVLALAVALAVRFRQSWEPLQQERQELLAWRRILLAGEAGTGLLSREVADLRLIEEVDRARQFKRPLGLLLVSLEPLPEAPAGKVDSNEIQQAVIRQLVSASLVQDIPFRADSNRLGLILPERDWDSLYRDTDSIVSALRGSMYIDGEGRLHQVLDYAQLGFGLGTYQGEAYGTIDLMRAAEDSLSVASDLAEIGETNVTAYAMSATPILDWGPVLADEEE